jgi:DNA processing protein
MEEKDCIIMWLCLQRVPGLGPVSGRKLLEHFQSPEAIFSASDEELSLITGVGKSLIASIKSHHGQQEAEKEFLRCQELGVRLIPLDREDYPENLRHIPDPPLVIYCMGRLLPKEDSAAVAVVGTREPTEYGRALASQIGSGLAKAGVTVVSGMARGIDSISQEAALIAGGRSIAVLGSGVDVIYPKEKKSLYQDLIEKGAVLSELPLGTSPSPENFPNRNRIISGLSLGVLVVQARSEKSGSLITARLALDQDRQVYALPGPAGHPDSRATNSLIKQGARLVEGAEDIIEDLQPQIPFLKIPDRNIGPLFECRPESLLSSERDLFLLIPSPEESPIHIDDLVKKSRLKPGEASGILLNLELQGCVRQLPGKRFIKTGY